MKLSDVLQASRMYIASTITHIFNFRSKSKHRSLEIINTAVSPFCFLFLYEMEGENTHVYVHFVSAFF